MLKKLLKKLWQKLVLEPKIWKLNYPHFWDSVSFINYLLLPASLLYYLGSKLRKLVVHPIKLKATVVCIGNINVGGSGKTQLVIYLSKLLKQHNINFVILGKGYGGNYKDPQLLLGNANPGIVGDEACELCQYGTVIVARSPRDAVPLICKINPDVVIMDDGMQNPSIYKDFTILIVDGIRYFGNKFLIPAGPLRQTVQSGISNSDAIIVVDDKKYSFKLENNVFYAKIVKNQPDIDKNKKYIAFAGIGNPQRFFQLLKHYNLDLIRTISFPDHYNYDHKDLNSLNNLAISNNATLITTRKDYVKIPQEFCSRIICFNVELEISNSEKLCKLIMKILDKNKFMHLDL